MSPLRARSSCAALCLVAVVATTPSATPSATAADPVGTTRAASVSHGSRLLADPAHGRGAVTRLGDDLAVAAKRNDLPARALRSLLLEDRTAWVDARGLLFYIDPAPVDAPVDAPVAGAAPASSAGASAPLADTFALHSDPGATRSIFLDFDGATVSGTYWNTQNGVGTSHPAWDPAGDGAVFSDSERTSVQKVWAMVAEDYAPWDVDVTTADPGPDGLLRSSSSDTVYGTHALITPSTDAANAICGGGCGGVAYLDVFRLGVGPGSAYDPAWIFPHLLGNSPKQIAEAATHEVGHNFGLSHDGNASQGYDSGHGSWAPIMGVGYSRPITQFSKGDYVGANNAEDDLAVIGSNVAVRIDEAGSTLATRSSAPAPGVASYVTTRDDVDVFALGSCTSGSVVRVDPAATSPNLDVSATLLDAGGAVVASNDPVSATIDAERASGLSAAVTIPAGGAGYALSVDGVGAGTWTTGYDDYASLGAYTVSAPGCTPGTAPGAPSGVTAVPHPQRPEITLSWSPPASAGSSPVTGYVVARSGADPVALPASARTWTATGLSLATSYDLSVRALNDSGSGAASTVRARTANAANDEVAGAQVITGASGRVAGDATTATGAPDDPTAPGGAGGHSLWYSWTPTTSGPAHLSTESTEPIDTTLGVYTGARGSLSAVATNDDGGPGSLLSALDFTTVAGTRYLIAVDAFDSGVGRFDLVWSSAEAPRAPRPPTGVTASAGDGQAVVSWTPGAAGTAPTTGYTVVASPGGSRTSVSAATTSALVTGLLDGTAYVFRVAASNAVGESPLSSPSAAVTPAGPPAQVARPSAVVRRGAVVVSWRAPDARGSAITRYRVLASGAAVRTVAGTVLRTTLRGLSPGRHTIRVGAANAVGRGPISLAVRVRVPR